jgi:sensor histidine kinase YesM
MFKYWDRAFRPFTAKSIITLLIALSLLIQLIVLPYNHYTGYSRLDSLLEFVLSLFVNTIISSAAGIVVVLSDLTIIRSLNKRVLWYGNDIKRIFIQLFYTILIAITFSTLTTLFTHFIIHKYRQDLIEVLIINAIIVSVTNLLLVTVLQSWIVFRENKRVTVVTGNLRYQLSQVKFDMLKSQINPHFMFNSLNILAGLIRKDTEQAQQFIEDFSSVYRYVAETIEEPLVTLRMELEFADSYLYLQRIRHGDVLQYRVELPEHYLDFRLPPLSLQVVLENAIKHNIIGESEPLLLELFVKENLFIVRNRINPKSSYETSTGTGLSNLTKRYAFVCNRYPDFIKKDGFFIAELPLIID